MTSTCDLYRYYDANGTLLYVGISNDALKRREEHRRSSWWFTQAARLTIEVMPTREAAQAAERDAIRAERPKHNRVHLRAAIQEDYKRTQRERKEKSRALAKTMRCGDVLVYEANGCPGTVLAVDTLRAKVDVLHFDGRLRYAFADEYTATGINVGTKPLTNADKDCVLERLGRAVA
jgi:predicted GIY-YIG superfamily endonuclease